MNNPPQAVQKDTGAMGPVSAGTAPVTAEALRTWLAEVCGGEVTAWRRLVSGNSRTSYAADVQAGAERVEVVVRHDEGGGPVAGTELSLEREATVYRALAGSGLPVPRLRGASSSLRAMAVTRMAGSDAEPEPALPDLLARLAELHRLAIDELELPGFARTAEGDLDLWSDIAHQKLAEPDEVVEFAFELLRELFPGEPERLVLTHGDAGEGNFLAQGDRVSALLDWEFAHLGDPIEDLAWCEWIVRTHHPDHTNALADFFGAYGGHVPDWPQRQAAMVTRCLDLQKFCERWEPGGRGAHQWTQRAHTTANWQE